MISAIISRLVILVFGTLYPAYASYKAVRTKNLKEYVKWMMYWIVFALFTCTETFTDVFLSWFPFYYEVKIVIVLWLLSPATKGSSILYRKFVHPALCRREQEIDEYIAKAKDQGYHTVLNLGTKGVNYATTVIMQTAIKGGGGLVQQIKKSYSLSDLTECDGHDDRICMEEATDVLSEQRVVRRNVGGYNTRRSASESNSRNPMYFPEVDVDVRSKRVSMGDEPDYSHIKSSEDISSGYSSADNSQTLTRTQSVGAARRGRPTRTTITTIKRPQAAEGSEVIIEELHDDDTFDVILDYEPPIPTYLSHTDPPFLYQYVGDQVKIIKLLEHPLHSNAANKEPKNDCLDLSLYESKIDSVTIKETPNINTENITIKEQLNAAVNLDTKESHLKTIDPENKPVKQEINKDQIKIPPIFDHTDKSGQKHEMKTHIEIPSQSAYNTGEIKIDDDDKVEIPITNISHDSADSDDEASFGTPEDSPKLKKKVIKGKYGKSKAPSPPKVKIESLVNESIIIENIPTNTSLESLTDLPDSDSHKSLSLRSNKIKRKSNSPIKKNKNSNSLGKLLHLPGKLAFWNKGDKNKSDNKALTSDDDAESSSENVYQADINKQSDDKIKTISLKESDYISDKSEDQISFKDASDYEAEAVTHDIMEKSDELQKLIEAKRESHPEYKLDTRKEEEENLPSKVTDV